MRILHRQFLQLVARAGFIAISSGTLFCGDAAWSQTRTIKFVVPYPPGGAGDTLTRIVAEQIANSRGVATLIENRPGAGTVIATEAASRASPDGNTVLLNGNSFVINSHFRKLSYDPLSSFDPICQLVSSPQVIVVNEVSPYRSLVQFLDAVRAKPGELTLSSIGPATTQHIAIEMLKRVADVKLTYVPFSGGAAAVNALLGNHVNSVLANYSEVAEHLRTGKLRALATTSTTRIDLLPNVPTVAELGFTNYEAVGWFGIVVPAKTPAPTLSDLRDWFAAALQNPEVKQRLLRLGFYPVDKCGTTFAAHLRKQFDEYGRVIKAANIKDE